MAITARSATPVDQPGSAAAAPVSIATVTLAAQAPEALARFYQRLGLRRLVTRDGAILLGAGDAPLLRVTQATLPATKAAGLFHTALLMPSRTALGRWLGAVRASGLAFTGASDHGVSEALHLDDPEGNGVEVYADRPAADWAREGDGYAMTSGRLDVAALLAAGGAPETVAQEAAMPAGTAVGHVHLRAADMAAAERLYVEGLGMAVAHRRPGAAWLGWGGYHHHVAVNAWAGALPPRRAGQPGLEAITLRARGAARDRAARALAAAGWRDPSGAAFALAAEAPFSA